MNITDWLLSQPQPWVIYNTHLHLLHEAADQPTMRAAYDAMVAHPDIQTLLRDVPSFPQSEPMKKAYDPKDALWKIQMLADFGLTRATPAVADLSEHILNAQSDEGGFLQGGYDHTRTWDKRPYACVTHILTYALVAFGYGNDARVQRAYQYLQNWQRLDGGWHPNKDLLPGAAREDEPSCPFGTVNTLRALAVHPELSMSDTARRGVDHVLTLWTRRAEPYRPVGFGMGSDFMKMQYPFVQHQLLKTLDTMAHFEFARSDARLQDMARTLIAKRSPDSVWLAEGVNKPYATFDFGQKKQPSPWLTFLSTRILRHILPAEND